MIPRCEETLSNFAFNRNLRHYTMVNTFMMKVLQENSLNIYRSKVGRCGLTPG